jgi:uncharacterized protein YciI
MAQFAILAHDKPDGQALRVATRPAHLEYIGAFPEMVRLAGPILSPAGDPIGSLFLVEAPDIEAVRAFAAADPYAQAGLFARVDITGWRATIGTLP